MFPLVTLGASPYPAKITEEDRYVLELIERARYWADVLVIKSPKYVWGGEGLEGGDCSGQAHWILKRAGAPFPRTTAFKIWEGAWPGFNFENWDSTTFPDGIFFSWKKKGDHMGLVNSKLDFPEQIDFIESSSGANKFKKTKFRKKSAYDRAFLGIRVFDFTTGKINPEPIDRSKLW